MKLYREFQHFPLVAFRFTLQFFILNLIWQCTNWSYIEPFSNEYENIEFKDFKLVWWKEGRLHSFFKKTKLIQTKTASAIRLFDERNENQFGGCTSNNSPHWILIGFSLSVQCTMYLVVDFFVVVECFSFSSKLAIGVWMNHQFSFAYCS